MIWALAYARLEEHHQRNTYMLPLHILELRALRS